jgi:hypothetical protein
MADFPLAFGLSRAYFVPLAPDAQPRGVPDIVGPFTAAFSQRGIVSDWPFAGKRKVYEASARHAHYTNSFSTSTKIVQVCPCMLRMSIYFRGETQICKISGRGENFPEVLQNKSGLWKKKFEQKFILRSASFRPREFVDSNRVAADDQAILQNQNHIGFQS